MPLRPGPIIEDKRVKPPEGDEAAKHASRGATSSPALPYIVMAAAIIAMAMVSQSYGDAIVARIAELGDTPSAPALALIGLIAACSFLSFYGTRGTPIPSFVVAIVLGIAGHKLFAPIVGNTTLLASLVTGSAAIILFGGGIEMPLKNFVRLLVKIALLAIPGVLITGYALSWTADAVGNGMQVAILPAVAILLGAILASTDPAAIIPVLQNVKFKRRDTKDIVIAESALNDVVGALLTTVFLGLPLATMALNDAYRALATPETYRFLAEQAGYGVIFGLAGYVLLMFLSGIKRKHSETYGADQVYFLAVPVAAFVGAAAFGGSGFLAAFIAGLLFQVKEHMKSVEHFFNQVIDGVAKPVIFLLVGALVDVQSLIHYAPIGVAVALIFMFAIRPAMVFLMLGVFAFVRGKNGLSLRELLFISFVRETGAIPAVLLVMAVARMTTPVGGLVEIGMWVILLTLVLAPPLTPWVARRLGVAE